MKNKRMSKGKKLGILILAIVIVLAIVYIALSVFFTKHYFIGTVIGDIKCSGKSLEGLQETITRTIDEYKLTINEREGVTETLEGKSINLAPDFEANNDLQEILDNQNGFAWLFNTFRDNVYQADTVVTFDGVEEALASLDCADESKYKEPVDAHISDYDNGYSIVEEELGTTVDKEKLVKAVEGAVSNLSDTLDLDTAGVYVEPKLYSDSEELVSALETANKYAKAKVTYTFPGTDSVVLEGADVAALITIDGTDVTVDQDKVTEWLRGLT